MKRRRVADQASLQTAADSNHPVKSYLNALVLGDEDAAAAVVTSMIGRRSISDVYMELLTPAMKRIGELWRTKKINVAQQKLATQITLGQMDRLRSRMVAKRKWPYRALVCCIEGEMHSTGARMAADLLRLEGWVVDFLGADVPTGDVVAMMEKRQPHLLALSITMQSNMKNVHSLLATLRNITARPKILIGGQGSATLIRSKINDLDLNVAPDLLAGLEMARNAFPSARPQGELGKYLGEIGQRIREARIKNGQTQAELAGAAGLNRASIVSVEHGKQNITMSVVIKIANALGVSTEQLLTA